MRKNSPATQLSEEALAAARKAFLKDVCKMSFVDPAEHPMIYNRIDNNTQAVSPKLYKQFFDCLESEFERSRSSGFALTGTHLVRAAAKELYRRIKASSIDGEVERRAEAFEEKMLAFVRAIGEQCRGRGEDEKSTFANINLYTVTSIKRDDLGIPVLQDDGSPVRVRIFDDFEVETARYFGADSKTFERRPFRESMALLWQHLRGVGGLGKFREETRWIMARLLERSEESAEMLFLRRYDEEVGRAEKAHDDKNNKIEDAKVSGLISSAAGSARRK